MSRATTTFCLRLTYFEYPFAAPQNIAATRLQTVRNVRLQPEQLIEARAVSVAQGFSPADRNRGQDKK